MPSLQFGDKFAERLRPGIVDVGDAIGVDDEVADRRSFGRNVTTDPLDHVRRVPVPQRSVEQVNEDPWELFGRAPDVGLHPVVGPDLTAEHCVPRRAAGGSAVRGRGERQRRPLARSRRDTTMASVMRQGRTRSARSAVSNGARRNGKAS